MPIIHVTLVEGRPDAHVEDFIRAVARAAMEHLRAPEQTIRVMVNEVPASRFAVGDRLKSDAPPALNGTQAGSP